MNNAAKGAGEIAEKASSASSKAAGAASEVANKALVKATESVADVAEEASSAMQKAILQQRKQPAVHLALQMMLRKPLTLLKILQTPPRRQAESISC